MKQITKYMTEKLVLGKKREYTCAPKTKEELQQILKDRLAEDKNANLNDIDVSNITDMEDLFYKLDPHNIDISEWNVSNVKNMQGMFLGCSKLKCDLSEWNVSNVVDMRKMFFLCEYFNSDLSKWNTISVKYTDFMFYYCTRFKGSGLENWNTSNIVQMVCMFFYCIKLNCDLSDWDISPATDINNALRGCSSLEKLPKWYENKK